MVNTRAGSSTKPTEMDLSSDVKTYLDQQFSQLLQHLATKEDISQMKDEVIVVLHEKIQEQEKRITGLVERIDQLEANTAVLECHVAHLRKSHDNQEQYSRRLCLRIDGIELPTNPSNETGTVILDKVKSIFNELEVDVPDAVIDRAHRIGRKTMGINGKQKQQVIVRFTTWRHRMAVYRARKKSKSVKIRMDLTKPRLDLLTSANEVLRNHKDCYAFADVNCRTRAKIGGNFSFFDNMDDLQKLIELHSPSKIES